jgi:catechol 2,3-dioxygenase-like lactoylglutathione lyase family enzyme
MADATATGERLKYLARGVDHVAFPTVDPAATVGFYHDILGFPMVSDAALTFDRKKARARRSVWFSLDRRTA